MCAMALKSYDKDLRNIAKISPKMTKNRPILEFFQFFLKNSSRFENCLSTTCKGLICVIGSKSYDWDSSESEGKVRIRLLYRTCSSGSRCYHVQKASFATPEGFYFSIFRTAFHEKFPITFPEHV